MFDIWTGQVVIIAMVPQIGLLETEAVDLAEMLSERARQGIFRDLLQ